MEGYVRNASPLYRHAMKRSIAPGDKVGLDELYEQYGIKYDIEQGKPFIDWLRQVKLKDTSVWEIRYKDGVNAVNNPIEKNNVSLDTETKVESVDNGRQKTQQSPFVKSAEEVKEIVNLSVRQAREKLHKMTNQKILKYALNEASQLSNKDTLCRMLRKRIVELELSRR